MVSNKFRKWLGKIELFGWVIGVLLTIFGITGTISILLSREYLIGLPLTAISVIVGVILIAWVFSN